MKLLELFAGTKSVGNVALDLRWSVFSTDIKKEFETDYTCDILEFDYKKVPFVPDVIWASPPCTWFTVMQIGRNWNKDNTPKTDGAKLGMKIVLKTMEIINFYNPKFWFIENPIGKLRKLNLIESQSGNQVIRQSVTYCQYGDTRMKPTDIWTNSMKWEPRPMCKAGMPCHVSAPRGSKSIGSTQGLKSEDASRIPHELAKEILLSCNGDNFSPIQPELFK